MLTRGSWYWNYIDQDYVTLQCCHLAGASLMFELMLRWYWSGQLLTPGRGFLELTFLPSSLPISILLSFLTMAGVGWPNSRLCELVSTSPWFIRSIDCHTYNTNILISHRPVIRALHLYDWEETKSSHSVGRTINQSPISNHSGLF